MTRSGSHRSARAGSDLRCAAFWLLAAGLVCCSSGREERAGLQALERALATLASAPREDREIRLEELRAVVVGTERLGELKRKCIASHEQFLRAERLLDEAKSKTREAEALLAEARGRSERGEAISVAEESRIRSCSDDAAALLSRATGALGQAEAFVDQCRKERVALDKLLAGQGG